MTKASLALRDASPVVAIPPEVRDKRQLLPVLQAAVHALSSAAVFVTLACAVLLLSGGPSEKLETRLWVAALAIALPAGVFLGTRQGRRLATTSELSTRWALAIGTSLLTLGLVQLRLLGTGLVQLAILGSLALAALGVTELAICRPFTALPRFAPAVLGGCAAAIMLGLFATSSLGTPGQLVTSVALAAAGVVAVLAFDGRTLRALGRRLLDTGLCLYGLQVVRLQLRR